MKLLKIEQSKHSPEIILDPAGMIRIRGRSIHENAAEFFEPVDEWITSYVKNPADVTTVNINLEYFNSASARIFISLFQKITFVALENKKFVFNWYFEEGDEDILERGEYFATVLDIEINFIRLN
jgi:hypothetical protein